jgi:hypothetical protein
MRRIIEVLAVAAPRARKPRGFGASAAFMAAMLVISAAPALAQGDYSPNYGPNGPYYGPYDYCVWSPYACSDYTSSAGDQGYYNLTYGPNGPYYGPYDYCVWSPYACKYY